MFGAEYMGTMQVVTIQTQHGRIKARVPASVPARIGDRVGLHFQDEAIVVFDTVSGRAMMSDLFEGAGHG